jgi:serine phosphatase RsbU (regulator of sigma subunit)
MSNPWADASALAALHACRTQDELDREFAAGLAALLPDTEVAVCLADDAAAAPRVLFTLGEGCPLREFATASPEAWPVPAEQRLAIRYRRHVLGEVVLGRTIEPAHRAVLADALVHYGTALVNLTLNQEARQATDNYCASLQALEEGIVLFQEEDPAAVTARLLSLASSMVQATAGALYVLREVGDLESGLQLEQALGIPESLLTTFRGVDGCDWPKVLLDQPAAVAVREPDGSLARLDPQCVPPVLQQLVVLPLRYHGVVAGVCLLFNPATDAARSRDHLGRLQSLGQLAAALLHRLRLEAQSANAHTIERELQIAETIQQRLLPSQAPASDEYEFAWSTIAAKNIGGDYLDLVSSDLGDIYAVIADASGHGINSALLMSSFRSTYRGNAPWMEPDELAQSLNGEVVHEVGPTGMFITAALLRFEQGTRVATVCSAGHCSPLLYRAATGTVESLASNGPPLGFVAGVGYDSTRAKLQPGDVLLLYTDGITEATDSELDMFGEERLVRLLCEHATAGAAAILAAAKRELRTFTGRERYDDDVSILVACVK